jgi:PAS domain S-box-containing protein
VLLIGQPGAALDEVAAELIRLGFTVTLAQALEPGAELAVLFDPAGPPPIPAEGGPALLALLTAADPARLATLLAGGVDDFCLWPQDRPLLHARLLAVQRRASQRRALEGQRAQSDERYQLLYETIPDPIAILDARTLRILECNDAFLRQYGYTADEARQLTAWDISNEPHATRNLLDRVAREGVAASVLRWHKRKDGSLLPVDTLTRKFSYRGRDLLCASLRDVSQRREMEAQLVLADRMATVGTLAAGVAHEINNPLSFVLSNVTWVEEELGKEAAGLDLPGLRRLLREALTGIGRVRDIVRDLRTFSQSGAPSAAPIQVRPALDVAVRMASNEIRHRARLSLHLEETPPVAADEAQLSQVFLNLLTNAVQALPERPIDENQIRVSARAQGDQVIIEVADNGRGMTEEQARRVFDPFFTTRPVGSGQGLGLSVCLGIVRGLGGHIDVETSPGAGSTFRVVLPRARRHTDPGAPGQRAAGRLRVLVVDDEPLLLRTYVRMLAGDHEVVAEEDPRAALRRVQQGEPFDAVLCDLMMPPLSGIDLYEQICALRPELEGRIGFLTGGAFTPRARDFVDAHPGRSLEKPFGPDELKALIAKLAHPPP